MIDALVVGLGNPGKEYTRTRHNVGAETVALLVERAGEKFKAGRNKALVADARIAGKRVVLAFPTDVHERERAGRRRTDATPQDR